MKLFEKNILVTGGTSGIGRMSAIKLAENGANIVISGRDKEKGADVLEQVKLFNQEAIFIQCDITDRNNVEQLFKEIFTHFNRLDCAFNNAGIDGDITAFHDSTEENLNNVLNTNLKGTWYCMKHEINHMLAQKKGAIINMSSTSGLVGNGFGATAYAASKHAIIGLTKSVALEYAKMNIRINAICPGFVETPMVESICAKNPRLRRRLIATHPIGRMGTVEEIANAVVYLCSDESSFMTGHPLVIDGGLTI